MQVSEVALRTLLHLIFSSLPVGILCFPEDIQSDLRGYLQLSASTAEGAVGLVAWVYVSEA